MKLAKKAFVIILSLVMIGCMSAIAFAAASIDMEVSEVNEKGQFNVTVVAKNAAGLGSLSYKVNYNPDEVTYEKTTFGSYTKIYGTTIGEKADPIQAMNDLTAGTLDGACALVESVYTDAVRDQMIQKAIEDSIEEHEEDEEVPILSFSEKALADACEARFVIATIRFSVKDTSAASTNVSISVTGDATYEATKTVALKDAPVETTTAKTTPAETTTAKTTPAETTTAKTTPTETTTALPTPSGETTTAKPASPVIVYKATGDKKDKDGNLIVGYDKDGKAIVKDAKGVLVYSTDTAANEDPAKLTPVETTTAKTTPSKTTPGQKTDNGKKTGDNSVLAVMAGVIALAGAAFVVTKKRK